MIQYTYKILRYVHDAVTQEFVNVGVVVYAKNAKYLRAKCTSKFARIGKMFAGIDGPHFRAVTQHVQKRINEIGGQLQLPIASVSIESLGAVLATILPQDDSAIQFGPDAVGVGADIHEILDELFERFVMRYSVAPEAKKKTEDVIWRKFRQALEQKNLPTKPQPKQITGENYQHEFSHALKNGIWHLCEPISFDFAEEDSILDRANLWVGRMTNLQNSKEKFKLHCLLGAPTDTHLQKAYKEAKVILKASPVQLNLFEETETEVFAESIAKTFAKEAEKL